MKARSSVSVIIITTLAMIGATTISSLSLMQEASAAKECDNIFGICYCYPRTFTGNACFANKADCKNSLRSDTLAESNNCFKVKD